ncbi:MAG: glucose-1-phosphate adenylyltransferase subunit GlgD [Atopobiaceae bacterium]|jgi:glucose-1-phosphate adenylyltransferase|nr:glucose-1-phosphate adenylyltransferase subunit GlgD [Atopobiaceae bacterium]MCH4277182.1 glucose-1-phosphate adenylyltransferase subunit GlgD [Atopobiaceae bacterium]MCI1227284.1 glucose-1-phosphate adenylyltransferase subunit GlgD [Atopobiaceae bacterium]MCI1259243.1 glucose-1-phosphate adenylyltransferase subunit GlgD [Atopobiaceae bacterium]
MESAIGLITTNYSTKSQSALTEARPVASLPYLGRYRLIDFPLSNMVNAGIRTVGVVMPYNYRSLIDHVGSGKDWALDRKNGGLFMLPGTASGTSRTGARFLLRDIEHNKIFLERDKAPYVVCCASNIVYNMDFRELIAAHKESGADITVVTQEAKAADEDITSCFVQDGRVKGVTHGCKFGDTAFLDCFIVSRELLLKYLEWYAAVDYLDLFEAMQSDFERVDVRTFNFDGFAAGIFNAASYFRHSMELLNPQIDDQLFPAGRPILTKAHDTPPAKYETGGHASNSLVSAGCRIQGAISDSILGRNVRVDSGATVRNSIVMQGCVIESGARVENAIVDRNNVIPARTELRGTPEAVLVQGKGEGQV